MPGGVNCEVAHALRRLSETEFSSVKILTMPVLNK